MARLYLSPPDLSGRELAMLTDAVQSGWIAPLGPHVDAFEAEMAAYVGVPYALALSSGTAALHLALLVAGVQPGDEVWLSDLTFVATANAVMYTGATPVFVDSELSTWNMSPALLAEALDDASRRGTLPRAVIAVGLYGQCAELAPIAEACRRHKVVLVEDAAEALGASYRGARAGSFGDLSILSFNGNKIMTTSGGGMLLSRERTWIERARYLSTQARAPVAHYEHNDVGYNYRLSNLLAAVGRAQLADLDRRVAARRAINATYRAALEGLPGWSFMPEGPHHHATFWLTCARVDARFGVDVHAIINALGREDIEARPVWKPMHMQPVFADRRVIGGAVSEALFADGICLPSGSGMTREDIDRVVRTIRALANPKAA
ncbi:MAG: DegT/DnrJ/EryC1/StrS family aminotransferase [Kofleriaceae bacterium]